MLPPVLQDAALVPRFTPVHQLVVALREQHVLRELLSKHIAY
jgi:hypothetical protein